MISSYRRLFSTFAFAILSIAPPAVGQTSDPNELGELLKTGDIITVSDLHGSETRGRLERVTHEAVEIYPITPGETSNEYRMASVIKRVPIDQIAGLSRVDAFGANPEVVFQHRDSFGTLQQRLKPGQLVRVIEHSGNQTVGKVTDVSASGLVLTIRKANPRDGSGRSRYEWGDSRTFAPATVQKIERPAHIWDGAVKGALVAVAATFLVVSASCRYDCTGIAGVYLFTGGIGAGIGLGVDALFGPKQIYRAPK